MSPHLLDVRHLTIRQDNYIWLFSTGIGKVAVVDPGEAAPVISRLEKDGVELSHILLTHHHGDHCGGAAALGKRYHACIIGGAAEAHRLPPLDDPVNDGDTRNLGDWSLHVMATPGHTNGHVVYQVGDALFTGDTLFHGGCGRLFEGSPQQMWHSLQRLTNLPGSWRIFPGHEYTLANLAFLLTLNPDNPAWLARMAEAKALVAQGRPTVPVSLAYEKEINPFLRCHLPDVAQQLGMVGQGSLAVFTALRQLRNGH